MVYRFTMGIRKNEPEWENTINQLIKDNQEEIYQILREYKIPLLDNLGNPLIEKLPFKLENIPKKRQEIDINKILNLK